MNNIKNIFESTLALHGYTVVDLIHADNFGRVRAIVTDRNGAKFFAKASLRADRYAFRSLIAESHITSYLSKITSGGDITNKRYTLAVPVVKEIIITESVVCLITVLIKGKWLKIREPAFQATIIRETTDLLCALSRNVDTSKISSSLKNYSHWSILLHSPFQFLKAASVSPKHTFKLLQVLLTSLLLVRNSRPLGLVHADINASNIWINGKTVYLTDWEEAGWGLADYNIVGPLSVHWNIPAIKSRLFSKSLIPLLSYRTLVLFSQRLEFSDSRRQRDYLLLGDIILGDYGNLALKK